MFPDYYCYLHGEESLILSCMKRQEDVVMNMKLPLGGRYLSWKLVKFWEL